MKISIKATIASIVVILSLALAAICTTGLWAAHKNYDIANDVTSLATVDKALFVALVNFRSERGDAASALGLSSDKNQGSVASVMDRRTKVDEALGRGLTVLADMPALAAVRAKLTTDYEAQRQLRTRIDAELQKPVDQRDKSLTGQVMSVGQTLIDTVEASTATVEAQMRSLSPDLSDPIMVRSLAWATRSNGGTVALILNEAVAQGRALTAQEARNILVAETRMQTTWDAVKAIVKPEQAPAVLKQVFAKGDASYFTGSFKSLRDNLVQTLSAGGKPTISIDDWRPAVSNSLNDVADTASVAIDLLNSSAEAQAGRAKLELIEYAALVLIAVILGGLGILLVQTRVAKPLAAMTQAMRRLAENDTSIVVPSLNSRDEIGEMAAAVQIFKETAIKMADLARTEAEREARQAAERQAMRNDLAGRFEASIGSIVDGVLSAAVQLQNSATSLSSTAEETALQAATVAAAANQATSNVQTVAAAAEELSASIGEIGSQVDIANEVSGEAASTAGSTEVKIKDLIAAAGQIGAVVSLINDIAGQTNLLALNATIEAARAGDSGRGFAVVASEVKQLADQTAKATSQIGTQIGAIQSSTQDSAMSIGEIAGVVSRLREISVAIAAAVEEQSNVANEIARNVQEAANGTISVSSNIDGISQASRKTSAVSIEVLRSANALSTQSEELRTHVQDFLRSIRAG